MLRVRVRRLGGWLGGWVAGWLGGWVAGCCLKGMDREQAMRVSCLVDVSLLWRANGCM